VERLKTQHMRDGETRITLILTEGRGPHIAADDPHGGYIFTGDAAAHFLAQFSADQIFHRLAPSIIAGPSPLESAQTTAEDTWTNYPHHCGPSGE